MMSKKRGAEKTVRDIRRATRRHYSAEEKIRIVLEGLRGEDSIAELCRLEGNIGLDAPGLQARSIPNPCISDIFWEKSLNKRKAPDQT